MSRPDAVKVPTHEAISLHDYKRIESVVEIAETLLECGPRELAWCHPQTGYCFCARRAEDTENHPLWHPQYGEPRYHWTDGPNGTKLGYLMSGVI